MKCEETRAAFLAGDADQDDLDHLASCQNCRSQWETMDAVRTMLDEPAFWESPAAELEDRVVALIGGAPEDAPVPGRRSSSRLVAAAAAVAAFIAIMGWVGLRTPPPDWEVVLPGTVEAPQATGIVKGWLVSGGTRVALHVDGLPAAPEGFVYEFWFTEGQRHVSAGTFVVPDDVDLWAGVSRAEFPRLWITLEPLDDDEGLSGVNVMDTG